MAARRSNPPGFNSNNAVDFDLMAGDDPDSTVAYGHVVEYDVRLCNAEGYIEYIGLFGDESGCALYDITATWMDEDEECEEGVSRVVEVR